MDSQDQSQAGGRVGLLAHTPRPWFLEGDDILGGSDLKVIGHPFGDTAEQALANGLVQAASLDLLDALQCALLILTPEVSPNVCAMGRAAISKALGQ